MKSEETLNEQLLNAVEQGDEASVAEFLKQGADPNLFKIIYASYIASNQISLLMIAAQKGYVEVMKVLLDAGARIDEVERWESFDKFPHTFRCWTALMHAAAEGNEAAVKLLIEHEAEIDKISGHQDTASIIAARRGHLEVLKLLLVNGGDINILTPYDETLLMLVLKSKKANIQTVNFFLTQGIEIDQVDKDGETAFIKAIRGGTVVDGDNESINLRDSSGVKRQVKFSEEYKVIADMLIENGANINVMNSFALEGSALMVAYSQANLEAIKYLVEQRRIDIIPTSEQYIFPYYSDPTRQECGSYIIRAAKKAGLLYDRTEGKFFAKANYEMPMSLKDGEYSSSKIPLLKASNPDTQSNVEVHPHDQYYYGIFSGTFLVNPMIRYVTDKITGENEGKSFGEYYTEMFSPDVIGKIVTSLTMPITVNFLSKYVDISINNKIPGNYMADFSAMITNDPFAQGLVQSIAIEGGALLINLPYTQAWSQVCDFANHFLKPNEGELELAGRSIDS